MLEVLSFFLKSDETIDSTKVKDKTEIKEILLKELDLCALYEKMVMGFLERVRNEKSHFSSIYNKNFKLLDNVVTS